MRALIVVVTVLGCTKPPPQGDRPPPPPERPDLVVQAPADAPPPPPPPVDALVVPVMPAKKLVIDEKPGFGSCKKDEDCELSGWQEGCCTGACDGYAISKVELARRIKKENCPAVRTQVCPPPSPCRKPTHRSIDAFCKNKTCWVHREVLPQPPPDPGF